MYQLREGTNHQTRRCSSESGTRDGINESLDDWAAGFDWVQKGSKAGEGAKSSWRSEGIW